MKILFCLFLRFWELQLNPISFYTTSKSYKLGAVKSRETPHLQNLVGMTLKAISFHPLPGEGHLLPDQEVVPGLGHFQGWGIPALYDATAMLTYRKWKKEFPKHGTNQLGTGWEQSQGVQQDLYRTLLYLQSHTKLKPES